MMHHVVRLGALLALLATTATAAVPTTVNFQGRLLDAGGNPVSSNVPMAVTVWTAETGGDLVYTQNIGSVEVANGLYDFAWGGAGLADVLTNAQCWLEVAVNGESLSPRYRLLAVPYALRAAEAMSLNALVITQILEQASAGEDELVYPAYEDISAGDAVGLSHFTPGSATPYDNAANGDGYQFLAQYTTNGGSIVAQRFTVPTSVDGNDVLRPAQVRIRARSTSPSPNLVASIRETLTGPAITSGNPYTGTAENWVDAGNMALLEAGQTYFITLHDTSTNNSEVVFSTTNTNPPPGSEAYASSDGGQSWAPLADRNYIIRIDYASPSSLGHYEVFKASAAALNERFSFYGYAKNDALAGELVTIDQSRTTSHHTDLLPHRRYYLSDTPGEIGPEPGTIHLELGRARSTNVLVRENRTSTYINTGSGTFVARMPGEYGTGTSTGSGTAYVDDRPDFDRGESSWGRSASFSVEGGFGGAVLKNGDRARSPWRIYFAPQLP